MTDQLDDISFFRTFAMVLGVLVLLAVLFAIVANMVTSEPGSKGVDKLAMQAVEERLAPLASVSVGAASSGDDSAPAAPKPADEVIASACAACHNAGVGGAPKIGENADWSGRFAAGLDGLVQSVFNGKGIMPPRGGNPALTDDEIKSAVVKMLQDSGITVDAGTTASTEPAAAAAAPAAGGDADKIAMGEGVYNKGCATCHGMGVAGAPKVGDPAAWSARIAQGMDTMVNNAINGFAGSSGFMPAKGGFANLSDDEVAAAVAYMANASK